MRWIFGLVSHGKHGNKIEITEWRIINHPIMFMNLILKQGSV